MQKVPVRKAVGLFTIFCILFPKTLFSTGISISDELKVPYVPHVVLNNTKDEFNYDYLQEIIDKYLESNKGNGQQSTVIQESADHGTDLYNYLLKTTANNNGNQYAPETINENNSYQNYNNNTNLNNNNINNFINQNKNPNINYKNPNINYKNSNINYKTPNINYKTPNINYNNQNNYNYDNKNNNINTDVKTKKPIKTPSLSTSMRDPYHQVTENKQQDRYVFGQSATVSNYLKEFPKKQPPKGIFGNEPLYEMHTGLKKGTSLSQWSYPGDMTCNIRSMRYIRSGDCLTRTPLYESVCAEKCTEYDPRLLRKKFSDREKRHQTRILSVQYYPSKLLHCRDGDTKMMNIKLHCKNGSIKNSTIRLVKNCVCMKYNELTETRRKLTRQPSTSNYSNQWSFH